METSLEVRSGMIRTLNKLDAERNTFFSHDNRVIGTFVHQMRLAGVEDDIIYRIVLDVSFVIDDLGGL